MSNWEILTPATVDKSTRVAQRWANTVPGSAYGKIPMQIVIPAFSVNPASLINASFFHLNVNWQCAQFNYTAPEAFTIATVPFDFKNSAHFIFLIRYRVGTTNYRYVFPSSFGAGNIFFNTFTGTTLSYTGQIIKPQFSIEVYYPAGFTPIFAQNQSQITFNTSIMLVPPLNMFGVQPSQIVPSGGQVGSELFIAKGFNLALPYNWPSDCLWNSN